MAGEWCPIDCNLATKPEVLELVDETGEPADAVIGRLVQLWLWSAMNSEDGTARMTVRRLCRQFGGSDTFWAGVQRVGWLQVDEASGTVAIPGWERRFSQAAKTRALHARRASGARERTDECAQAHAPVRRSAPERGDRGKRNSSSSSAGGCAAPEGWDTLRKAWNAGPGRKWTLPTPPEKCPDRLAEEGWFGQALLAIERLPKCRFFTDPVTLIQFVKPGFVEKVLGGQYDSPKAGKGSAATPDAKASADELAARFNARDPDKERQLAEFIEAKRRRQGA